MTRGVIAAVTAAIVLAGASSVAGHAATTAVFPHHAAVCANHDIYVVFSKTFPQYPPQITVYVRSPDARWDYLLWYRYEKGLYYFQFYPGCSHARLAPPVALHDGSLAHRHTGLGTITLRCRFPHGVKIQQRWTPERSSLLTFADPAGRSAAVVAAFSRDSTTVSWGGRCAPSAERPSLAVP